MPYPLRTIVAATTFVLALAGAVRAATPVSTCGQVVQTKAAFLTRDLSCAGDGSSGVVMERGGVLDLHGFSIRNADLDGVTCLRSCTIYGPGTIIGNQLDGVSAASNASIKGVTVTNNGDWGVEAQNAESNGKILAKGCTVYGNRGGLKADRRLKLIDTTVNGNRVAGAVVGLTCGGRAGRITLNNSTVMGNDGGPECAAGTEACFDLFTCHRAPRLQMTSTCGTSCAAIVETLCTANWGICQFD